MSKSIDLDLENAVTAGDAKAVGEYIASGGNANSINSMGYTLAAWCVVRNSGVDVLSALHEGGADLTAQCHSGLTPAELAVAFCRTEMLGFIAEKAAVDIRRDLSGRGVAAQDYPTAAYSSKELESLQKMINSLRVGAEIEDAMGPLEGAFSVPPPVTTRNRGISML